MQNQLLKNTGNLMGIKGICHNCEGMKSKFGKGHLLITVSTVISGPR